MKILKVWNKKVLGILLKMQVQPRSQKLYLDLREVTLGMAEAEDFTGNGISKIFLNYLFSLKNFSYKERTLVFTVFCLVAFPIFKTFPTSTVSIT